jgi:flagellar motor component MotA
MKYGKIIIGVICLVCLIIFCIVAITGKIYTLDELPLNFMSAFLGAIVTAVLTLILLSGQSSAEEIKERNVIVFNKKTVIFEDFINRLYKILQEQRINGYTYREIKTEFYTKLVLYLKKKSQREITGYLEKLVDCTGIDIDDKSVTEADLNYNYDDLREYIFKIINILIVDLGLGGKIDTTMQKELEEKTFPCLFSLTLLEEVDNIFINKHNALFKKAFYVNCIDGVFICIAIKGKNSLGGRIEIGPFYDNCKNESCQERLKFRLQAPALNPVAEPYASDREANNGGKYINFFFKELESEFDEIDQLDLTSSLKDSELEKLEKEGIEKDIFNKFIFQFGFNNAYNRYCGFFVNVCRAIAVRAYFYFFTAKTDKDGIPIKDLCEKFGEITEDELKYYPD